MADEAHHKRMEYWTRALGVGSQEFLEKSQGLIFTRLETKIVEQPDGIMFFKRHRHRAAKKGHQKVRLRPMAGWKSERVS